MSLNPNNKDNRDSDDDPKPRKGRKKPDPKPIDIEAEMQGATFKKFCPGMKKLEEAHIVGKFDKFPAMKFVSSLGKDEIEITYICRTCNHKGKAFCRMPTNKEHLMDRVMTKCYTDHAMTDLMCKMERIDVRMVNMKGELV